MKLMSSINYSIAFNFYFRNLFAISSELQIIKTILPFMKIWLLFMWSDNLFCSLVPFVHLPNV